MSARRRDNTPPYEIMGSRPASPQASGRGPRPRGPGGAGGVEGFIRSVIDAWQAGASEPLTLRVPRGMALILLAGLLGLLILAYWVGYSRGGSAVENHYAQMYPETLAEDGRTPPERAAGGLTDGPGSKTTDQATHTPPSDPRTQGLNYLVVARYPQADARRLMSFLEGKGVDVMIDPGHNTGLRKVFVLDKGLTSEEYGDDAVRVPFRNKYLALGRQWQAFNDGRGDNLSTMYFEKYKP